MPDLAARSPRPGTTRKVTGRVLSLATYVIALASVWFVVTWG
jgi:hypothetical protein